MLGKQALQSLQEAIGGQQQKSSNGSGGSGKGILAADESSSTIKKRFDAIGVESTEDSGRDYREMLFRSKEAMSNYISGVILFDETIRQSALDDTPFPQLLAASVLGVLLQTFFRGEAVFGLVLGGVSLALAGLCTLRVAEPGAGALEAVSAAPQA